MVSGGAGPALLKADALSRLQTTSNPNPVQKLTAAVAPGDGSFQVDDFRPFPGGSFVYLTSGPSGGGLTTAGPYQVLASGPGGVAIVGTVATAFVSGDYVVSVPAFAVIGDSPVDRPVDSALSAAPAIGATATITFPAQPNLVWKLAYFVALLRQTGATAGTCSAEVWDGTPAAGTKLFADELTVNATAGDRDRLAMPRLPVASSPGNALTVRVVGIPVTAFGRCQAGAWQTPKLR